MNARAEVATIGDLRIGASNRPGVRVPVTDKSDFSWMPALLLVLAAVAAAAAWVYLHPGLI
jgi:hypothetical protein